MTRPAPSEIAAYFHRYMDRVPDGDILSSLEHQGRDTQALLQRLDPARAQHRYAPGKWTVGEVVGHLADAERIMSYRALCFARADKTPLPGFEEDDYVANANFAQRSLASLAAELASVRAATMTLFAGLDATGWARAGTANNNPMSVRSLAWVLAGHELHHLAILRERYGVS